MAGIQWLCVLCSAQATASQTLLGGTSNDFFGSSVAVVGDVDADGIDDILIGAPFHATGGVAAGASYLHSGADGTLIRSHQSTAFGTVHGSSVAAAGDVNDDGVPDYIVGAPGLFLSGVLGSANVYSGTDGSVLHTFWGDDPFDLFGYAVSGAGDVDNDGFDDLIVGAPQDSNIAPACGSARVFSGFDGSIVVTWNGDHADDSLGCAVAKAGDINADGQSDVIVGICGDDNTGNDAGAVRVYSAVSGVLLQNIDGAAPGDQLGWSVAGPGDVDWDGIPDFAAGSPAASGAGTASGRADVFSGNDGSLLHTLLGTTAGDMLGTSLAAAGDLDADCHADLIIGAPGYDIGGTDRGAAYTLSGRDGSQIDLIPGTAAGDEAGTSVAGGLDSDQNLFSDFVVGARMAAVNGAGSGSVMVWESPGRPALAFQSALGESRLHLEWLPDSGNAASLTGTLSCSRATPGAQGLFGVSYTPIEVLLTFGFPLLIAIDAANLADSGNFGFSFAGDVVIPGVTRQFPSIAGVWVFLQFYEIFPSPAGSNGIALLMAP